MTAAIRLVGIKIAMLPSALLRSLNTIKSGGYAMKNLSRIIAFSSIMILAVSCGSTKKDKDVNISKVMKESINEKSVEKHISQWPADSKKAADTMIQKYGLPEDVTKDLLVWRNIGPFAKAVVYKTPTKHLFPTPHNDVIEHFVYYASPSADKVAQIWEFSGSVGLDRTMGMMSARSDSEAANILALNLADQIIKGEKTIEDARLEYGKNIVKLTDSSEQPSHLTQTLVFSTNNDKVGDPDHTISDQIKRERIQAEEIED